MEGILKFANGKRYTGHWHGDIGEYTGDVIFYTGMGNFLEFMTDPAIKGKIVIVTYPGVLHSSFDLSNFESEDLQLAALVTQQELLKTSITTQKWMSLFKEQSIPVLTGTDTRAMVKDLLNNGEMSATIYADYEEVSKTIIKKTILGRSGKEVINPNSEKHLVVLDFGIKKSLISWLRCLDYKLTIISGETNFSEINKLEPDGLVFSGGSGNPTVWNKYLKDYKELATKFPTIGFGLGHQILALSFGAKVDKMKWGHRNFRQPIIHIETKKIYSSNQNHGYSVSNKELELTGFKPSFLSIQDGSIEGLTHEKYPINTYQFHPDGRNLKLEALMKSAYFQQLEQSKGVKMYA
ncbi:carbamoyl phosphate synthase small subunit [Bacillus niameyensis]|uniref:carbamoyl phosphate synthase small subunit n=1 Tax=Bacillus niameyensis TaxID=1522308 RepID=UPI0007841C14|nr:carbamoyl phosphate synthase small subunit [Bacillus niameyensis]